jgi:hypothetical protein
MARDASQSASTHSALRFMDFTRVCSALEVLGDAKFFGCRSGDEHVRWEENSGITNTKLTPTANGLEAKYLHNIQTVGVRVVFDFIDSLYTDLGPAHSSAPHIG